jgi:hypothetical protein
VNKGLFWFAKSCVECVRCVDLVNNTQIGYRVPQISSHSCRCLEPAICDFIRHKKHLSATPHRGVLIRPSVARVYLHIRSYVSSACWCSNRNRRTNFPPKRLAVNFQGTEDHQFHHTAVAMTTLLASRIRCTDDTGQNASAVALVLMRLSYTPLTCRYNKTRTQHQINQRPVTLDWLLKT